MTIDVPILAQTQQPWQQDLQMRDISEGPPWGGQRMVFIENLGWQIEEYQNTLSTLHEQGDADDALIPFTTSSLMAQVPTQRVHDELPGVDPGDVRSSGDLFWKKRVPAGDSWDDSLSADSAAVPAPGDGYAAYPVDRVAVAETTHRPDRTIWFTFRIPGIGQSLGVLVRLYFSSIPTVLRGEQEDPGTGLYCLTLQGDGQAFLSERSQSEEWRLRKTMVWASQHSVAGSGQTVSIRSDARRDTNGKWQGSKILFHFDAYAGLISGLEAVLNALVNPAQNVYVVRQVAYAAPVTVPVRLDLRRNVRAHLQVTESKVRPAGTLRTHTQKSPVKFYDEDPDDPQPIKVAFYGDFPEGISGTVKLFCEDDGGNECDVIDPGGIVRGEQSDYCYAMFKPVQGKQYYYAELEASTADPKLNCTIRAATFVRDMVSKSTAETADPIVAPHVRQISFTGPDSDPSHETAQLVLPDPGRVLDRLEYRAEMPVRIEVKYDPEDETKTSTLFQGRIITARGRVKGTGPRKQGIAGADAQWPRPRWREYTVLCAGEWHKLWSLKAPKRYDYFQHEGPDGRPTWKVTDVVRDLLADQGAPYSNSDIPDLPQRLFTPQGGEKGAFVIEPFTPIGPIILEMIRTYLGGYLVFDANASKVGPEDKFGCWRLIIPPRPPYRTLCHFVFGPTHTTTRRLALHPGAYEPGEDGVKRTFVARGYRTEVQAPEGNYVIVDGVGQAATSGLLAASGEQMNLLRVEARNWEAADFGQPEGGPHPMPNPNHPDYTDGEPKLIYHSDPSLNTRPAVLFALRRIYDMAAHARRIVQFEAPLVLVTDPGDPIQRRPRPLRYGDIVTFDGAGPFYVMSCNSLSGSGQLQNQMAAYEIASVPALLSTAEESPETKHQLHKGIVAMSD